MNNHLKNFQIVSGVILVGILLFGFEWTEAQSGPGAQPGVGSGAISADSLGNVGFGGAAGTGIKLRVIASTSDLTTSALQLLKQNGGIILNARGDGYVGIGTSTPAHPLSVWGNIQAANGGSFIGNMGASNITAGVFGSGNFAFQSSLGISTTTQVGLPQALSVYGSGYIRDNLGLGVSSPAVKLDVAGALKVNGTAIDPDSIGTGAALGQISDSGIWAAYGIGMGSGSGNMWGVAANSNVLYIGAQTGSANTMATVATFTRGTPNTFAVTGNINATGSLCIAGDCRANWAAVSTPSGWTDNGTTVTLTTGTDLVGINRTPSNALHVGGNIGATGWVGAGCETACSGDAYSLMNSDGTITSHDGTYSITLGGGNVNAGNVRKGLVGVYDPAQTQAVFAMGSAYVLTPGGASSNIGNFYGIGWSYEPDYGGVGNNPQSKVGLGHQALFMQAGTTRTAIGQGIWTAGTITGAGTITSPTGSFTTLTGTEVYANSWFRNNVTNTGIYNQINGRHLYSSGSYWVSTANALLFRNGYEGAASGYVYTDYSNFGLLNNAGSWAVQIPNGGVAVNILGTLTVGGGTGKINVGTVDPIYTIEGKKYATYLPAMTGQKEETTGTLELSQDENGVWTKEIDFKDQEEASDLWLFAKATDIEKQFDKMTILLTPGFNGKVWYERDSANLRLVIHGEYGGEVSYRLSAPRFDAGGWDNRADKEEAEGFNLDKLLNQ